MKEYILRIIYFILSLIEKREMTKSVTEHIENHIVPFISGQGSTPTMIVKSETINSVVIRVDFLNGKYFCFKLEYHNRIRYYYEDTNLVDLFELAAILEQLKFHLSIHSFKLEKYFIVRSENS